jgi:hypothetical protein
MLTARHEWILTSRESRQAPAKDITLATMNYLKLAVYQLLTRHSRNQESVMEWEDECESSCDLGPQVQALGTVW